MTQRGATLIGFMAIVMWATLATFSVNASQVPPFQLTALTFLFGGLVGVASWVFRRGATQSLVQDWKIWALGVGALFSYHALYFAAIQNAPAIEVSLIAYLWPMLIVVFSGLLPGEHVRLHHLIGTALGLIGAVMVISRGRADIFTGGLMLGHFLAFPLPLIWAGYSLMVRRSDHVPTDVISGFCLATAILSWVLHLGLEPTIWPTDLSPWLSIIALGIFPLGLAFYAWDFGLKHGDIFVLGALSYLSPLLSTLLLVTTGLVAYHWSVMVACLLITIGAMIAVKDTFKQP